MLFTHYSLVIHPTNVKTAIDIIYCAYLQYCNTSGTRLRQFQDYIRNYYSNPANIETCRRQANTNWESPVDIINDIDYLQNFDGVSTLSIFYKALIHSQLFEVPLRRQSHHLYTLSEFADLPKHTNSFVCFHDEGKFEFNTSFFKKFY